MHLLRIVQELEGKSDFERCDYIKLFLTKHRISYSIERYKSGENILVKPKSRKPLVAISSHFDVVPHSPGANDNASAIAVCLAILIRLQEHKFKSFTPAVFFFDQEECGLKGSKAYVNEFGIADMLALINLELVGQGDRFALWSLSKSSVGKALNAFEEIVRRANIYSNRYDQIVTNSADHMPFRQAGLSDSFTITCVSEADLQVASHYYKAQEFGVDAATLREIMQQAPLFQHYHKPTDLSSHLSEDSLQMTTETVWNTLVNVDG